MLIAAYFGKSFWKLLLLQFVLAIVKQSLHPCGGVFFSTGFLM